MTSNTLKTPPPPETAAELSAYRSMVADIARASDGRVIVNRSEQHAAVMIENLFRCAKDEINILTENLYRPIYGNKDVVEAASAFLRDHPQARVRVLSENPIPEDHPLLSALRAVNPAGVLQEVLPTAVKDETPFHFAVADALCFRYEPDKKKFEAYGRFGEPVLGARLKTTFDTLYSKA